MHKYFTARRARRAAAALAAVGALQGCDSGADTLLEAIDPDIINPSDTRSAEGAQALYIGSFSRLRAALIGTGDSSGDYLFGGLLADEWSTSSTFIQNDEFDQRKIINTNSTATGLFRNLNRVRTAANQAIAALREFRPTETHKIAEMYLHRGLAEMQMAQDFCNGTPISDAAGDDFVFGTPESNAQVFQRAVASFDSALALTTAANANNTPINNAARVAKARALLNLGTARAPEAAALVPAATVPNSFTYDQTFTLTAGTNNIWGQGTSSRRFTVGDSLEGNARNLLVRNALPFFSARDPRVPVSYTVTNSGRDTTKSQDGFTYSRTTTVYGQLTNVAYVNGLDARLVEAEARLIANDFAGMTTILNALRAAPQAVGTVTATAASLPALAAPTTRDAATHPAVRADGGDDVPRRHPLPRRRVRDGRQHPAHHRGADEHERRSESLHRQERLTFAETRGEWGGRRGARPIPRSRARGLRAAAPPGDVARPLHRAPARRRVRDAALDRLIRSTCPHRRTDAAC